MITAETRSLFDRWREMKDAEPTLRPRDAAERLGVSEGALADLRSIAGDISRLALRGAAFADLLNALRPAGRVMTLTRNPSCVSETYGKINAVKTMGAMGQIVGPIDLRLFFSQWHAGYAIAETARSGLRHSIQIFDASGDSVLKIFATDDTDMDVWRAAVDAHGEVSAEPVAFAPAAPREPDRPDAEIDVDALRAGWRALEHSHDFHRLLRETGAGRLQALRLAGAPLATEAAPASIDRLLHGAAESGLKLMVFCGNQGCIQIFSGGVETVKPMGPWINVLDPDFHMHLRTDRIASLWRVVKPTSLRGEITSIEMFDAEGEMILQVFGLRAPGEAENPAWTALAREATQGAE